jgi:hypothetical protein
LHDAASAPWIERCQGRLGGSAVQLDRALEGAHEFGVGEVDKRREPLAQGLIEGKQLI